MDDFLNFPWEPVLSHFVWILGASLILATFSYHEYLVYREGAKRSEVFKRRSFVRTFLWGLLFLSLGISLSLHVILWKVFFATVTLGIMIILYVKK